MILLPRWLVGPRSFPSRLGLPAGASLALAVLLFSPPAHSQERPVPRAPDPQAGAAPRTLSWMPFAYYTPETGVALGVLAAVIRGEEGAQRVQSSLRANVQYTLKGQASVGVHYEGLPGGRWLVLADGSGRLRWPDRLYTPGNRAGRESYEEWTSRSVDLRLRALRHAGPPGLFLGPVAELYHFEILKQESGGLLEGGEVEGAEDHGLVGVGVAATWDSRDSQVYPRAGAFHSLALVGYTTFRGSVGEMGRVEADLRRYQSLGERAVLALRGRVVSSFGDVPFTLHAVLGGLGGGLRGIYERRYADRTAAVGAAELRLPLFWRVGGVVFAGAGQVAPDPSALSLKGVHGAAGAGLRFTLMPASGMNLGVDFARGEGESGLYFMLGEVF